MLKTEFVFERCVYERGERRERERGELAGCRVGRF
jgi:hypothetical protein